MLIAHCSFLFSVMFSSSVSPCNLGIRLLVHSFFLSVFFISFSTVVFYCCFHPTFLSSHMQYSTDYNLTSFVPDKPYYMPQITSQCSAPKLLKHRFYPAWVIHFCQFPTSSIHVTHVTQASISMVIPCAPCLSMSLHVYICLHFTPQIQFEFWFWRTLLNPQMWSLCHW